MNVKNETKLTPLTDDQMRRIAGGIAYSATGGRAVGNQLRPERLFDGSRKLNETRARGVRMLPA